MNIENLRQQVIKVDLDGCPAPQKINHAMNRASDGWNPARHVGAVGMRVCFPPKGHKTAQLAWRFRIAARIPVAYAGMSGACRKMIHCSARNTAEMPREKAHAHLHHAGSL